MARKASLEARIGLNSSAFTRGLAGLRRSAARFAAGFGRAIASAGKALLVLGIAGVAAASAGLAVLIKKTADYGDVIDKMSKRTGTSVEFLQKLKHAAELGGSSLANMEKGIRTLAKSTAEAGDGMATYADEFDKLGVSVRNADGDLKSTEAIFVEVAEALAKVESSTERVAIAQTLLGRSGTQVLAIMADGAKGFAEAMQEAEDLGLIMSAQDIKNAAEFNDQITRTKGLLGGLGRGFAARFLPALNAALVAFRGKIKELQDEDFFVEIGAKLETGAATLIAAFTVFSKSTDKLATIANLFRAAFEFGGQFLSNKISEAFGNTAIGKLFGGIGKLGATAPTFVGGASGAQQDRIDITSEGAGAKVKAALAAGGAEVAALWRGEYRKTNAEVLADWKTSFDGIMAEMESSAGISIEDAMAQAVEQIKAAKDALAGAKKAKEPADRQFDELRKIGANIIGGARNNVPEKQLSVMEKMQKDMRELVATVKSRSTDRGAQF